MAASISSPDSRPCEHCGSVYFRSQSHGKTIWSRRRYCSDRCRCARAQRRWRGRERDASGVHECVVCDKPLTGVQLTHCSRDCANEEHRANQPAENYPMGHGEIAVRLGLTVAQVVAAEESGLRKLRNNKDAKRLMREWVTS